MQEAGAAECKPAKRPRKSLSTADSKARAEELAQALPADWSSVSLSPGASKRAVSAALTAAAAARWQLLRAQVRFQSTLACVWHRQDAIRMRPLCWQLSLAARQHLCPELQVHEQPWLGQAAASPLCNSTAAQKA